MPDVLELGRAPADAQAAAPVTPLQLRLAIAAGVALLWAASLAGAAWWGISFGLDKGRVDVKTDWLRETGRAMRAAEEAAARFRVESDRRAARQQELIDAAEKREADRLEAMAAADAAAVRWRVRLEAATAAARRRCPANDPAPVQPGPPAPDPADLLADVPRRLEEAGRQLAGIAQERGDAGLECQQEYDALKVPKQ